MTLLHGDLHAVQCLRPGVYLLQVTLSIELDDSQADEFEKMIPVQLAQPPWNYTQPLKKGITVCVQYITSSSNERMFSIVSFSSFL